MLFIANFATLLLFLAFLRTIFLVTHLERIEYGFGLSEGVTFLLPCCEDKGLCSNHSSVGLVKSR